MSITENSTFSTVVGIVCMLVITLLLGSYAYTWTGFEEDRREKSEWRKSHDEQLDKRFSEVKQGQDKVTEVVNRSNEDVKELLRQLLEEQRRANQLKLTQQRRER